MNGEFEQYTQYTNFFMPYVEINHYLNSENGLSDEWIKCRECGKEFRREEDDEFVCPDCVEEIGRPAWLDEIMLNI